MSMVLLTRHQSKDGSFPLPEYERHTDRCAHDKRGEDRWRVPRILRACPFEACHQEYRPCERQHSSEEVDGFDLPARCQSVLLRGDEDSALFPVTLNFLQRHEVDCAQRSDRRQR